MHNNWPTNALLHTPVSMNNWTLNSRWIGKWERHNRRGDCSGWFLPVCLVGIDALCCFPACLHCSTARLEYQAASHWPAALHPRPIRALEEFRDTSEVSWYEHGERCHFQPLTRTTHAHFQKMTREVMTHFDQLVKSHEYICNLFY